MDKIRALVFPIGSIGLAQDITPDLETMQRMVGGGDIKMVPYNYDTMLVCSEAGAVNGQAPNRTVGDRGTTIFGPFFFVGPNVKSNSSSLTKAQIDMLKEEFDA